MTDTSARDLAAGPAPGPAADAVADAAADAVADAAADAVADAAACADPVAALSPAPRWVAPVYVALAVLLVPWIVYLGAVLPDHTTSAHWDVAWVGFDVAILLSLVLTAWSAYRRSNWLEASATATATLLVVDAWFDCTTARGTADLAQALLQAFVVELPLAALSFWIARHAVAVHTMATRLLVRRRR